MANLATINDNILADSGIDPINLIVGTGTVNYIPKFTAEGTIGNSIMTENGANILISSNIVLHAGNYNSYAPTLTGGGASGTWGINISGNAATATNADTVDGLHASAFALTGGSNATGTWPISITGSASSATAASTANLVIGTSGGAIQSWDIRTIAPSSMTAYRMGFGFTSWDNNNTAPWADYLHLRSYGDGSGGNDNLVMFLKSGIGMRIYQQAFNSSAPYVTYADVLHSLNYNSYSPTLTGGGASGTWAISITGNANTLDGYDSSAFAFANGSNASGTWGINITGTAGSTALLTASGSLLTQYGNGTIGYTYAMNASTAGLFPASDNSNATITISRHPGDYYSQLGFSSNGEIYYRRFSATVINTTQPWVTLLTSNNYASYAVQATFQYNWNSFNVIANVVGLLAWKNYGSNHVIFDASQSTSPSGTAVSSSNSQVAWTPTYPTLMGWNGSNTYGVRVDSARVADSSGSASTVPWSGVTGTPTTLAGYGITDAVPSSRTLTINGVTYDLSANRTWTIAAGVTSIIAGTGISVNQAQGDVTISNTGVLSVNGNTGAITGIATTAQLANYLPLAGGTMSGTIFFVNNIGTALQGTMGDNDFWRIYGAGSSNAGYLEIATSDDATEPIYISQYTGVFNTLVRRLTLLDGSGNTSFPGFAEASGSFRAPLFYDSTNTAYYLAPSGDSNLNGVNAINFRVSNAIYFGGGNNYLNWDGNRISSNVGIQSGVDMRAPIFYDTDNTAFYGNFAGVSRFNITQINSVVDQSYTRITNPEGGFNVNSGPLTGAIKIKLPPAASFINVMMSLTVQIFNYQTGTSRTIRCGGYNYFDGSWYNVFAYQIGDNGTETLNVRFGVDGTSNCIWIGETTTYWSYPNVFITDIQAGHSQSSFMAYGWNVSFVTSFDTVQTNREAYFQINAGNIASQSVSYAANAGNANTLDGYDSSAFAFANGSNATGTWGISISGNSATTSQTNFTTLTLNSQGVATQAWVNAQGFATGGPFLALAGGTMAGAITMNGNNINSANAIYANIFYDAQDTGYYVDPNSVSRLSGVAIGESYYGHGYPGVVQSGSTNYNYNFLNGSWSSNVTAGYLANCADEWEFVVHDSGNSVESVFIYTGGRILMGRSIGWGTTYIEAAESFRAPIFYDSNDTGYYVDPNGTSVLYYLQLNAAESANLYGIRGRFTNEYMHLYNKVGVGNPSGWGAGESATPTYGLSTWGGNNFAYGNGALSTFNGQVNIKGSSMYVTPSQLHIGQQSSGTAQMSFESWGSYTGAIAMNAAGAFSWGGQGASSWNWKINCTYNGDYSASGTTVMSLGSSGNLSAYSYQGNSNVNGTGSASYHPSGIYSTGTNWLYGTMYMNGNNMREIGGIGQNNIMGRPNAQWGAGGGSTGAVVIKFPGGTGNYGMVHAVIDIYEYNGNNVSTVIVGGHNWGSQWYSYGANVVGYTNKQVRVGVKDGQYCIVIGDGSSTWSYGQVVLRKIQNGAYYTGVMDVTAGYTIQIESDTYSWISGDLRTFRSSGSMYMNEQLVATQSWVNSQGFVTGGPYLPLSGGTVTGTTNFTAGVNMQATSWFGGYGPGSGPGIALENIGTFARFAFWGLDFYDWNNGIQMTIDNGYVSVNNYLQAGNSLRAPIFYDSNDTYYYVDPNSVSRISSATIIGELKFQNGSYYTNLNYWGARFYSQDDGNGVPLYAQVQWVGAWYTALKIASGLDNNNPTLRTFGITQLATDGGGVSIGGTAAAYKLHVYGTGYASSDFRAPIFYDSDDTSYYLNPNGISNLYSVVSVETKARKNQSDNNYTTAALWTESYGNTTTGIAFHISGVLGSFLEMRTNGVLYWANNPVITSGNYNSYSPTLTGGGASGTWGINITGSAGYATNAGNADTLDGRDSTQFQWRSTSTIDMSGLDQSLWYPVTVGVTTNPVTRLRITNALNSNVPSWSTHPAGFTLMLDYTVNGSGWGTINVMRNIQNHAQGFANVNICGGLSQMGHSSQEVIYLRGGGVYFFQADADVTPVIRTSYYEIYGQSVQPTSSIINEVTNSVSGMFSTFNLYTAIIRDINSSSYYLDMNASSVLNEITTTGRIYSNEWIQFTNYTGLYSPNNGAHFRPNNGTFGPWLVSGTRNGWSGIEFESLSNGNVAMMINSNSNVSGWHNNNYGWQFKWENGTAYVYKNSYGGGTQATVLDSANYNSWAAYVYGNVSNTFGVFSVNYATTQFNPSAAPRTTTDAMSIKMWDNYFAGIGLGVDYGTVMQYYGRAGHVDTQVYFDATGNSWYRVSPYASGWASWQQYLTSSSFSSYALPLAGGTMSGSIGMGGNNITNIAQVQASYAIFTNDISSRVMYLRGSGNIIQFQDAAANNKWEVVGRDGQFYVYKNDGAGQGYIWQVAGNGTQIFYTASTFNSTVTATGFFESSDARLKTVVDENYRVDSIVSIKPKFYEKNGKFEAGYIAQEVQEIYSHAVTLGIDGYLSLSYGQIHTLKIAALEDSVDEIKKKIQELEQKLNTLH